MDMFYPLTKNSSSQRTFCHSFDGIPKIKSIQLQLIDRKAYIFLGVPFDLTAPFKMS